MARVTRRDLRGRLPDAVNSVMATTGCSKEEAQHDICQAIADGAIKIRRKLRKHTTKSSISSDTERQSSLRAFHTNKRPVLFDLGIQTRASRPEPVLLRILAFLLSRPGVQLRDNPWLQEGEGDAFAPQEIT